MAKLPLNKKIFFKVFGVVVALVVLAFVAVKLWLPKEWTTTNFVGASISSVLFSYLVHLWMLSPEELGGEQMPADETLSDQNDEHSAPST